MKESKYPIRHHSDNKIPNYKHEIRDMYRFSEIGNVSLDFWCFFLE